MLGKFVIAVAFCLGAAHAQASPRAPRTLLIDACGQMRDNALRIWSDQKIVSIREDRADKVIHCLVGGADRKMKPTFRVASVPASASAGPGRDALAAACRQMQEDSGAVFGGRKVYFTEDPDIKVAYCLVQKPDGADLPELAVTDPRFVFTVELLFLSYYGEPLDERA